MNVSRKTEAVAPLLQCNPGFVQDGEGCPIREVLDRVGDTWSLLVIINLQERPVRFNALRRSIEGISQRMLTVTLRSLERDGLVRRTVRPTTPPEVEYALTGSRPLACASGFSTRWLGGQQPRSPAFGASGFRRSRLTRGAAGRG